MNYILRKGLGIAIFIAVILLIRQIFGGYATWILLAIFIGYCIYVFKHRKDYWMTMAQSWHDMLEEKILGPQRGTMPTGDFNTAKEPK